MKPHRSSFARALRLVRKARALPQEAFALVSSRTYVSSVERGIKTPTLTKIDELATVLRVHPLTLLALSYGKSRPEDVERMLDQVRDEALGLMETLHP